ncbi:hypothetical protein OGAPHI_000696 [Ogataea philodendri]|uniref:Zn(2)-C6 fungal-type domain-containing protein n=1 Tax=Ogataea philodendri TaxID=1378263 RepID=A0A9P8TA49_9ASCO|nr:uncharacterized protein OGAPHI_000696 [Ogataea philodendri]KAH3670985.1 hypothetical protein OGAPHI_000696 [Ogataea philodendri]
MALSMDFAGDKSKRSKSRSGCLTCKKKRLKCGEEKPACLNCVRKKIVCGGYQTHFKWKGFNQTSPPEPAPKSRQPSVSVPKDRQKSPQKTVVQPATKPESAEKVPSSVIQKALEAATLSVTGKSAQEVAIANALMASGRNPDLASSIASTLTGIAAKTPPSVHGDHSPGSPLIKREESSVEMGLDDESKTTVMSSYGTTSNSGISPLNIPSPDLSESISSPLNLFKDHSMKNPHAFAPGNILYEILNSSTTPDGKLDSPRLISQLEKNPSAMEQYQMLVASPNYSSFFKSAMSPLIPVSPFPSTDIHDSATPSAPSPAFSSIINAFASFEHSNVATPDSYEIVHQDSVMAPHHLLRDKESPKSAAVSPSEFSILSSIPKVIELNDQSSKILNAYERYTSAIMSIKNGPSENPWRTLFLPLTQQYPVVCNAVSAMACFHLARGDSQLRSQGMKHMKSAIVDLVHGLSDKTLPPDVALASCLALAMGEAWDRHVTTGIGHLRGARTMILQIMNNLQGGQKALVQIEDGRASSRSSSFSSAGTPASSGADRKVSSNLQFLFNTWMYFDVLARMTTDPDEEEAKLSHIRADEADDEKPRKKRKVNDFDTIMDKFQESKVNSSQDIDPLLGVMQKLFPIIGNVAGLIHQVRRESKNTLSIITQAVNLKRELENWKPPTLRSFQVEDPLFDLPSTLATAEAYRYSTLLYLHQAVPEIPSKSSHNLAEKVLMLLASIPDSSRTCVTHIYPLLVASCEALPGEEREWVKEKWKLLGSKMWLGSIDRSLEVVKEVWSRKDIMRRKREQERGKENANHEEEDDSFAYLSKKINEAVNGDDDIDEEDSRIKSWTHWTTVMKEWGWEVLLA